MKTKQFLMVYGQLVHNEPRGGVHPQSPMADRGRRAAVRWDEYEAQPFHERQPSSQAFLKRLSKKIYVASIPQKTGE